VKIAYVLSRYPVLTETFIKVELQTMLEDRQELRVYPLRGAQNTAWVIENLPDGGIGENVRRFGFALSPGNLAALVREAAASPRRFLGAVRTFLAVTPAGAAGKAKALFILPKACRIAGDVRGWGADHVHAHFANLPAAVAVFVARLAGITCSYTSHAFDIYGRDAGSLARLTAEADFVATISERNRSHYREILPGDGIDKVKIVHCGIDLNEFQGVGPATGPLVAVGRLVPKKGFDVLVRAVGILKERGEAVRCLIIGEGEQRAELAELIARHGLEAHVELAGPRPPEDVRAALASAAAFVLPCVQAPDGDVDGIPVSLMEAMAMEKVVVTTPISGITELVTDGVDGLLVPQCDPVALAEALAPRLHGGADAEAMGRRARLKIQAEFDSRANARLLRRTMADAQARRRP